jgi:hypothetical protein
MLKSTYAAAPASFASGLTSAASPFTDPGKLTIIPVLEVGVPIPVPLNIAFVAMFNPDTLTVDSDVEYDKSAAAGSVASQMRFSRIKPRQFNFEILLDGTGASGEHREVMIDINIFRKVTGFFGDIHRPAYLLLVWGTFIVKCVLTKMSVKYTLFRENGTPLRATISASFTEYMTKQDLVRFMNLASPDLTHILEVRAGDKLPLMCHRNYNDSRYYLEIARVNGLVNFRSLKPGQKLVFPPLEKEATL